MASVSVPMVSCAVASLRLDLSTCFKLTADATPPEQEPSQFADCTDASNL